MKQTNIRKLYYRLRHQYLTTNNIVIIVALVIAAGWAWGSIGMMQRNFALQKDLDDKNRQLQLVQLQTDTLKYQQNYYRSAEYQDLAARQNLDLASPGESMLVLPPNSAAAQKADQPTVPVAQQTTPPSNFDQWMNFLFGSSAHSLQK